jgi:ferric-dicitrate binding protein FerR (iron transport regulator)
MDKYRKIKMLLDMQEHPEQFSEQELEQMLSDAEAQELMEATAQLKRAMKNDEFSISEQEIEDEWQAFAANHLAEQKPQRTWLKIAAMFIGVLFMTGIAFAAIHIIKQNTGAQEMKQVEQPVIQQPVSTATVNNDTIAQTEPVIFDNVTLDSVAKEIADYHHIEVDLQNELAKQLRFYFVWKQDDDLQEVVEKLNMFDHVDMTIENGKLIVR